MRSGVSIAFLLISPIGEKQVIIILNAINKLMAIFGYPAINTNLIGATLFSGGGIVDSAFVDNGINPTYGVECNPKDPKLSAGMRSVYRSNFDRYGGRLFETTVEDFATNYLDQIELELDVLHASPMCSNFSVASRAGEKYEDIRQAWAVCKAIETTLPRMFTLENVTDYEESDSLQSIVNTLKTNGYRTIQGVLNCADFGVPQARRRFWLIARRDEFLPQLPKPSEDKISWYDAIADIIPFMDCVDFTDNEKLAIAMHKKDHKALLLRRFRSKANLNQAVRTPDQPCFTIVKSWFDDGKGNGRTNTVDVWLRGSDCGFTLGLEAYKRLQTIPAWYDFYGACIRVAGSIVGYSVPAKMYDSILKVNVL